MPAHTTVCKGLSEAQAITWEAALAASGLSKSQALEEAIKSFVEQYGELWPVTQQHGGVRVTVGELVVLMDALMIDQLDGASDYYDNRAIPPAVDAHVVDYAVARGYCVRYPRNTAAPTLAGATWHWNHT